MVAVSREEAKIKGDKYYNTGRPCIRGHLADRYVSDRSCTECALLRANRHYESNKQDILAKAKQRYAKDPSKMKKRAADRRADKPEEVKRAKREEYRRNKQKYVDKAAEWAKSNPGKVKQFIKNWAANNPDKAYQYAVDRRMKLKQRLPDWLTQEEREDIRSIYRMARQVSQETGIPHQVDHIIPLRGAKVSGLHVPGNLQILTAADNRAKTNTYIT